ncbi:hypothetical protein GDO81_015856 [Engystomops pustulosus]|uniref:Uncharacterized protein n=1 Tax=Engystomops pustulosus TaxID=76066 RepID=A0AAV7AU62_ENGPU|nr:hypothetical protein GDO81_015856 [Engystomops pustulosus]
MGRTGCSFRGQLERNCTILHRKVLSISDHDLLCAAKWVLISHSLVSNIHAVCSVSLNLYIVSFYMVNSLCKPLLLYERHYITMHMINIISLTFILCL